MTALTFITSSDDLEGLEGVRESSLRQQEQPVASRTRRLSSTDFQQSTVLTGVKKSVPATEVCRANTPSVKKIAEILLKAEPERSQEEIWMLEANSHLILPAENYIKVKQEKKLLKHRLLEVEESPESIETKTEQLADLIRKSKHVVIYTGAGISTSASIPDYRGPNGLWTQIKKTGTFSITKVLDLSSTEPTYTHMAIKELCRRRIIKHVVSQNCDGLHLRSGISRGNLSEIHGNMYIEVCPNCERQYFREADVTQQTSRFRHKTGRKCHSCPEPNNNLIDTIVLYGERSRSQLPMNWDRASKAANNADLIICIGSSLKTLRRYGCLWPKFSSKSKSKSDINLVIINLQHTSKDKNALIKINGKCDLVMENLMKRLNIQVPAYNWSSDPLLELAVPFTSAELVDIKRNLIFGTKKDNEQRSESPIYTKRSREEENRDSPSLFVSELTNDSDGKKRLRMRIRAINVGAAGSGESPEIFEATQDPVADDDERADDSEPGQVKLEPSECDLENLSQCELKPTDKLKVFEPPGWLGKGLSNAKSSSYRRKRHGNKGRKRTAVVVNPV